MATNSWKPPASQSARSMNVSMKIDDQDLLALLKAMNKMDKESKTTLKREVFKISEMTATALRFGAVSKRQKIIANTIRARWDRVPTISVGGSKKMSSKAKYGDKSGTVGDALFGVEFGAKQNFLRNGGRSFPQRSVPYGNRGGLRGYWIFPTLRHMQPEIKRRWYQAVDDVIDVWGNQNGQ
jgi:hypothetical protein